MLFQRDRVAAKAWQCLEGADRSPMIVDGVVVTGHVAVDGRSSPRRSIGKRYPESCATPQSLGRTSGSSSKISLALARARARLQMAS